MGTKPKTPQPKTPDTPQGKDLFQSPSYATDLLVPYIPQGIKSVWEPACGEGRISRRLVHQGIGVYGSDIRPCAPWIYNFLDRTMEVPAFFPKVQAIVTNPPYRRCR